MQSIITAVADAFGRIDQNDNWVPQIETLLEYEGFELATPTPEERNDAWFIVAVIIDGERFAVHMTCEQYPVDDPRRYTID